MANLLCLIHIEHGLPLLEQLDLVRVYTLFQRGSAALKDAQAEGAPDFLKMAALLGTDFLAEATDLAKGLAERRVLRELAMVASSTDDELVEAELDPAKMQALMIRAAKMKPLEALSAIGFFIRQQDPAAPLAPAFSGPVMTEEAGPVPEDPAPILASSDAI